MEQVPGAKGILQMRERLRLTFNTFFYFGADC